MNGTYGLIAEQGFYCVLAAIVLIVIAIAISYFQIPDTFRSKISKETVRKSIDKTSKMYVNLMLFGTTEPKITFSIRYSDIIKQAKEEKSDIMYKCWKNTARTIKQSRENV